MVMSTNYALEWTRPDFSFVQSKLAKYMHRPGPRHFAALKRFLRYIKGTLEKGVVFDFCSATVPRPFVYGFFDAAHADDLDTRRSTIAYVLFWAGVPILYKTKLHTFVTTSTNHSELVAAAFAARAAKRLWVLFSCLGFEDEVSPIDLFTDSAGCLYVSRGEGTSTALRHVELADFFARELIRRGIVTMTHVRTGRMVADVLTKSLPVGKFRELRAFLVGTLVGRQISAEDYSSFPPLSSQSPGGGTAPIGVVLPHTAAVPLKLTRQKAKARRKPLAKLTLPPNKDEVLAVLDPRAVSTCEGQDPTTISEVPEGHGSAEVPEVPEDHGSASFFLRNPC